LCDHASNRIPPELGQLGLPESELERHIAWDIGAAGVTEALSAVLDAPAVLCETSRLVIDCNRQLDGPTLIPVISDGTAVPGNVALSDAERRTRIRSWFWPYHDAIETLLAERSARAIEPDVIAVHSMTPSLAGSVRPWQIALASAADRRLTDPVLAALRARGDLLVGDNEPYDIDPDLDFSIPFHALRRGRRYLQLELRQDEIDEPLDQRRWALILAEALAGCS